MIERSSAKNGCPILKWQGRHVCSSVDPANEAESWAEKCNEKLRGHKNVFVLGVGAGYHLVALQRRYPNFQLVAIDFNEEFVSFAKSHHSLDLAGTSFIHCRSKDELKKNSIVQRVLKSDYTVLIFPSAFADRQSEYLEIASILLARDAEGLQLVLGCRPELRKIFLAQNLREASSEAISIKTLEGSLDPVRDGEDYLMWKALRELVN